MASLKHLVVAAMAGLVVLAASVSTDAAAVPAVTSSAVDALSDADLSSALTRLGATDDAASEVETIVDADADANGDEEALALDDASSRPIIRCKRFIIIRVCKRTKILCKPRYAVRTLDGADGADAVDEAVAADTGDAAGEDMEVNAADRQHKELNTIKNVVADKKVILKPRYCIRKVCKRTKTCILFY